MSTTTATRTLTTAYHSRPSHWKQLLWAGACFCACGLSVAGYGKAVQQVTLQEQLNQTYAHELVLFPFTAAKGACAVKSLQVTGPRGPVPAQLMEVSYWPGKTPSVKTARLAIVVDGLAPLATDTYTITYGTGKAPAPAADLQMTRGNDSVEITTSHLGLRLPLGEMTYPTPVAVANVPGPLQAMRLGDGAWVGGSALTGDVPVKSWSARVTDAGPAFARVALQYTFADGNTLALAATLAAGDSSARWEMSVPMDRPGAGD